MNKFKFHINQEIPVLEPVTYIAVKESDTAYKVNEDSYYNVSDVEFFITSQHWIVDEIL